MTDFALPNVRTLDLTSDVAKARVRARYRTEARFKFYGLAAIGLTALFLVVVLTDIVVRGYPAFWQHRLVLDVPVDRAEVDPQGSRDPAVIRAGDFHALVRNALRAQFPDVSDRIGRRMLDGILSSGASDVLRERVVADPALIGQTVKVPVLLSDDADLYYKGTGTRIERRPGRGILTPSGTTGDVVLLSSSNDFASDITTVKQALSAQARGLRKDADGLRPVIRKLEARKAELERGLALAPASETLQRDLASLNGEIESLSLKVKELDDQAAGLQARFDGAAIDWPGRPGGGHEGA